MQSLVPPPLNFKHLELLTDDTGILQHAKYRVPNRIHGYCVDDNARALLVVTQGQINDPELDFLESLATTYLGFLFHGYNQESKRFHNFLSYDRQWLDSVGSEDCHARAVWALGFRCAMESEKRGSLALELFYRSLHAVDDFVSVRGYALSILGMDAYLSADGNPGICNVSFERLAVDLKTRFQENGDETWHWLEDIVSYDNARIPQALILAGIRLDDPEMRDIGLDALNWLMELQTCKKQNCFSAVGQDGWFSRGGGMAKYDQQPLEAAAMVDACLCAFDTTRDSKWFARAETCLSWFLGQNRAGYSLYDPVSGGCRDGLGRDGVNENQGAESTLSWLLALLAFYSAVNKIENQEND